ncbi:DNA-binding protein [Paraburkholderia bengalensis]|uniref:DNA-binding protein n=1 Tax=Paraburkholderia bengalensis TaxID=2747562 RepID=A0ABU8IQX5_9BURK
MNLESDIAAIRERVSDTQALYREVCGLIFFRYGETPTANRLYQLVRKGSMSAPAKALRDFWASVREQTRVDIGHPDLPPDVAKAAGELVATLWRLSGDAASNAWDAFRLDAQREIDAAREQARLSASERDAAVAATERALNHAADVEQQAARLQSRVVELETAKSMLSDQLMQARHEATVSAAALSDARREFGEELEKLRQAHNQSEQRMVAAEKRALLEIDTERTAAREARNELRIAVERAAAAQNAHLAERDELRDAISALRALLATSDSRRASVEEELASTWEQLAQQLDETGILRARLTAVSDYLAKGGRRPALSPRPARRPLLPTKKFSRRGMKTKDIGV